MESIEFTNKLGLTLVESMGTDMSVIKAARVSTLTEVREGDQKLLEFLMKNRHASPFEHCIVTFLIEAPIFVTREWHRHRSQSFNEQSGRYTEMLPKFYLPSETRPLQQIGKVGHYKFVQGDEQMYRALADIMENSCTESWEAYQSLLSWGVAKEVARMVLPVNTYTKWYATANLRNWLNFLSLRTEEYAMYEIRMLAYEVESYLHKLFPWTVESWNSAGRGPL